MKLNSTPQSIIKPGSSTPGYFPALFSNIAGVHIVLCPLSQQPHFTQSHTYFMNSSFARPGIREMNLSTNGSALHFVAHTAQYKIVNPDHQPNEDHR